MRVIRRTRQGVQCRIVTLRNPQTGSTVTLAGVRHAAEQRFFDEVKERLLKIERDGALIYFEGERSITHQPQPQDRTRLVHQSVGLPEPATWRSNDISLEMYEVLSPPFFTDGKLQKDSLVYIDDVDDVDVSEEERCEMRYWPEKIIWWITPFLVWRESMLSSQEYFVKVLVRNRYAIGVIEQDLAKNDKQDFGLLWGGLHVPGMVKLLRRIGYKIHKSEWLTVISTP